MPSLLEQTADTLVELFDYNRENFRYDRKQRQLAEYQLASLRIEQVKLWREDVKDILELTPQKMEVYLLVITLELGFCLTALCKGRVPPGAPIWLIACHTLAICAAIMYLFMALWFGMHAFVSAQAYKVRILTQLVRLPVPTWQALEGARTYSSAFETQNPLQVVRVPFVMGQQSQLVPGPTGDAGQGDGHPGDGAAILPPSSPSTSDPWGLEERPGRITELEADVNIRTERQRHIWLVREASKFFQTYDAFCRVSMSVGTTMLANFFCYFCLSYLLTENAAPAAAWAGMFVFGGCALVIMRQDLQLRGQQYLTLAVLNFMSPALSAVVTFKAAKSNGHPGGWEYLMPIALSIHGIWLFYFVTLLRVKESKAGTTLPMAYRSILFLDAFAWARHGKQWFGSATPFGRLSHPNSSVGYQKSLSTFGWSSFRPGRNRTAQQANDVERPRRPEEFTRGISVDGCVTDSYTPHPTRQEGDIYSVSFRPDSFAGLNIDGEEEWQEPMASGAVVSGEPPGIIPYRVFLTNTTVLGLMWWVAATIALWNAYMGKTNFLKVGESPLAGNTTQLEGFQIFTHWGNTDGSSEFTGLLPHPIGLACDPDGHGDLFVTSALLHDGGRRLLYGTLSAAGLSASNKTESLRFMPANTCAALGDVSGVQDLAVHGCKEASGCRAVVLPKGEHRLLSCPIRGNGDQTASDLGWTISTNWLDDSNEDHEHIGRAESLASIEVMPCGSEDCAVVGTTAHRVVQMLSSREEKSAESSTLVPSWLVSEKHGEVPGSGVLARIGTDGKHLAILQSSTGLLQIVNMAEGGTEVGRWLLQRGGSSVDEPRRAAPQAFASICSSGSSLYALGAEEEDPSIWRFPLPEEVLREEAL